MIYLGLSISTIGPIDQLARCTLVDQSYGACIRVRGSC